ncbi:MAG TPA: competence/damage-inducible protein A [Mobilitalea sp.]|nr:competence/damage-inducible protein A [Mobilitalea sp.]
MTVELISVGTELLMGNIVNTNANYLSIKCAELGFSSYYQVVVGDNDKRLGDTIRTALQRSDIVILTGGLGPTQDDLTKETVAKVLGRRLLMDEPSKQRILGYFKQISYSGKAKESNNSDSGLYKITDNNWKQALKIEDCIVIDNDKGTAPGYIVEDDGKRILLLPGPPGEMIPMFNNSMLPYLKKLQNQVFVSKMVKVCGIGESKAETMILDLIEGQRNPTIAPYAKTGEVHFRVTCSADTKDEAKRMMEPLLDELKIRFKDNIYTLEEEETLENVVVKQLKSLGLKLATAESCTGGLLAGRLVNVSGVSEVLQEGFITYSNEAKMKSLGVNSKTLEQYGAVSEETAIEMAVGAAKASGCDVTISTTGIAGPEGGTEDKPVGLVYLACQINNKIITKELRLRGDRQQIRERTVVYALDLIRHSLLQNAH